ncbi:unnamed protein product [Blepharisma stoltei]|uniref:Uncharacterized protein n=1 Tax=Blepharisma stoltei TaxID=1481888 RepID=A0AAU9K9R8_9CILI|nr:unnamed protein product [Blepharisma stoltei]
MIFPKTHKPKAKSFGIMPKEFYDDQVSQLISHDKFPTEEVNKPSKRRVSSYIGIYNVQLCPNKAITKSKSTKNLNKEIIIKTIENPTQTLGRVTTASTKTGTIAPSTFNTFRMPEEAKSKSSELKLKRLKDIKSAILRTKSDQLEIIRDIATYENYLCDEIDFITKISRINQQLQHLPEAYEKQKKIDEKYTEITDIFKEKLKNFLVDLDHEKSHFSKPFVNEKYAIRPIETIRHMKLIFACPAKISGIYGVLKVFGNGLYNKFSITFLRDSEFCLELKLTHDLIELDKTLSSKPTVEKFKKLILPHLYIILRRQNYQLLWDQFHSKEFLVSIISIKGKKGPLMIRIDQSEPDKVDLAFTNPNFSLQVDLTQITKKKNLFLTPHKQLFKKLTSHIVYKEETGIFKWYKNASLFFTEKEENSKFLDMEYVHQHLGVVPYTFETEITTKIDEIEFKIIILSYKDYEKAEIHRGEDVKEILFDSQDYRFIKDLQGSRLSTNIVTISKSIEFKKTMKKLFNVFET